MDSILIPWNDGKGNIVVDGDGGEIRISSDTVNNGLERRQVLVFRTDVGNAVATLTVIQKGTMVVLTDAALSVLTDMDGSVLMAKK